jgi:hypothetical protein
MNESPSSKPAAPSDNADFTRGRTHAGSAPACRPHLPGKPGTGLRLAAVVRGLPPAECQLLEDWLIEALLEILAVAKQERNCRFGLPALATLARIRGFM